MLEEGKDLVRPFAGKMPNPVRRKKQIETAV